MVGVEAKAAGKQVAELLAAKWDRSYAEVCGYVRARLSLALVRATSLCLRGAREKSNRIRSPQWDSGSGLALYR